MLAPRNALRFSLSLTFAVFGSTVPAEAVLAATPRVAETTASGASAAAKSTPNSAELQFHVLAGELAAGRNQPEIAAQEFLRAVEIEPNAELIGRATSLALAANKPELALNAARKWLVIEPTSLEAREVITRLTLRLGMGEEAFQQCVAIVRDHPGGKEDGYRHVALLLSQESGLGPASLALMTRLVTLNPKLAGAWQAQSLLALRFDDIDTAEKAAREGLRLQPNSKELPLLLIGALVKKGDYVGSDQLVEAQVKGSAVPADLRLTYARLLIEANQRDRAKDQLQKVLKAETGNVDAHFMTGLLALDEGKVDEAEAQLVPLSKEGERAIDAHYYLGRISEVRGQLQSALAHYDKVDSGNHALDAAVRRATMLAKLGHLPDARTTLDQLRHQFPPLATRFYLAEGEILVDSNELDQAIDLYGMAIKSADDESVDDLLYARSLAYERLNRVDQAEADLRAVIAKSPNDARAMNALGFMLIVHTKRYDEAEKLVARALEITPDEPAVIDSLGWLRFRQGRNNEAVTLLARAYERFPDPEVAAHLGEALWVTGDRDQAQTVWNRALHAAPDNSVLRETVKRLAP